MIKTMKKPVVVFIPDETKEEVDEIAKIISEFNTSDVLKDRLFIVMDSDISNLLSDVDQLLNLASQIKTMKANFRKQPST